MSEKIENRSKIGKTERGRETLPAAHLGHLPVAGPAPPPGRPSPPPPLCLLPPLAPKQLGGERRCRLGHLLLPPRRSRASPSRHALPLAPCTSPLFPWTPFSPLLSSLHAPERSSSSPTPFAVATVLLTATRSTQEIRLDHLFLLAEKRTAGAPATSPPPASSTSGPPAIFVKFVGSGASPSSPRPPSQPL